MTTFIGAICGLDYDLVDEHQMLGGALPLYNDLEGANGLYTYRIFPAFFAGQNGGASDEPYDAYEPDKSPVWRRHDSTVMLAQSPGRYQEFQNQGVFSEEYRETLGTQERRAQQIQLYESCFRRAMERSAELIVAGTKMPDIAGHFDCSHDEAVEITRKYVEKFENFAQRADNHLIISDHGFKRPMGGKNRGIKAHTPNAVLKSDFCQYETMSELIENWQSPLEDIIRSNHLQKLGYTA